MGTTQKNVFGAAKAAILAALPAFLGGSPKAPLFDIKPEHIGQNHPNDPHRGHRSGGWARKKKPKWECIKVLSCKHDLKTGVTKGVMLARDRRTGRTDKVKCILGPKDSRAIKARFEAEKAAA